MAARDVSPWNQVGGTPQSSGNRTDASQPEMPLKGIEVSITVQ